MEKMNGEGADDEKRAFPSLQLEIPQTIDRWYEYEVILTWELKLALPLCLYVICDMTSVHTMKSIRNNDDLKMPFSNHSINDVQLRIQLCYDDDEKCLEFQNMK